MYPAPAGPRHDAESPPVRVAFVISHATRGGAEMYIASVIERLGPEWVAGVAFLREGPFVGDFERRGFDVSVINAPAQMGGVLNAARQLRRWPPLAEADVVHGNGVKAALVAGLAQVGRRAPVLWMKHDLAGSAAVSWAVAALSREIVAVSGTAGSALPPLLPAPVRVVYDGIPDHRPDPVAGRAEAVRLLQCGPAAEIVVHVGRLCPGKGQTETLEVAPEVLRARPQARFLILGEEDPSYPGFEAGLRERVRALELDGRVTLAGQRDDAVQLVSGADILVAPSMRDPHYGWSEGFGLAVAEAMWVGTPVLVYANGSLPEVVGDAGIVVGEGDREALASSLVELLADPARREALSAAGVARAREKFGIDAAVDAMKVRYRALSPRRGR